MVNKTKYSLQQSYWTKTKNNWDKEKFKFLWLIIILETNKGIK